MDDKAMTQPGPMGWRMPDASSMQVVRTEEAVRAHAQAQAPMLFQIRDPKPKNLNLLNRVHDLMEADGFDRKGFSFPHFEKTITSNMGFNWKPQLIGSCVASGSGVATAQRAFAEVFLHDQQGEELLGATYEDRTSFVPFLPYSYRAGRRKIPINGGAADGRNDGSLCMPHVLGMMEGLLLCDAEGLESDAFPEPQSEALYRRWGADDGLYNRFKAQANKAQLLESPRLTTADQAAEVIGEHCKPAMICSLWAFAPDYTHPTLKWNGQPLVVYKRDIRAEWAHNMTVNGFLYSGGKSFVVIQNTWANAHRNGRCFILPSALFHEWLAQTSTQSQAIGELRLRGSAAPFEFPNFS